MAIIVSILLALLSGVTVMFNNKYFWGKESNDNIATINSTLTSVDAVYSVNIIVILAIGFLAMLIFVFTLRGF